MKKTTAFFLAVATCTILAAGILAGCNGGSTSSSSSSASSSATSSASSSATSSSSASSASSSTSSASSSSSSAYITIDGVDIKDIGVDMVGDTPNLMVVFSNNTDNPVEIDCGKFEVKKDDGSVINFTNSKKTIDAKRPYAQWAFTAKPGSLSAGDIVTISYDGTSLGTFEVTKS